MDSLEQAREALTKLKSYNEAIRDGKINYRPQDHIDVAETALAALSRPVNGVKGEPVAWLSNCCVCGRIVDTRESHQGGDAYGCELSDGRWTCSEPCWSVIVDPDEAAPPVADSEALRERVAELERERDEAVSEFIRQNKYLDDLRDDHDHWRGRAEATEARLPQAERGPAVTEALEAAQYALHRFSTDDMKMGDLRARTAMLAATIIAALEAALHPQSAAGEEGK